MSNTFFSRSDVEKQPLTQSRIHDMVEYLRQLALYRKVNNKKLSPKDKGRIIKEIHFMEKKIMQHIDFSEYLLKKQPKYRVLQKKK